MSIFAPSPHQVESRPLKPASPAWLTRSRRFLRSPKGLLLLVFLPLLVVGGVAQGWSTLVPHIFTAVAGACMLDVVLCRATRGTWEWPSGALLSGLIVAMVLGSDQPHWVVLAVAALATASKYLLRIRRSHVFNPAALALLVSIPLFATTQSWWGAPADLPWPWLMLLLGGGALMVDRLNKFSLVLAFLATYFGLFTLVGLLGPNLVAEMFRPPFLHAALFLASFMLTDPPTSPIHERDQLWIGALDGLVCCGAQLLGAGQAYLLLGVLAGNAALVVSRRR
jgi:Na+-translocating ferredoxin:NAD+ oxidoreductase RnfD subunit